MRIELRAIRYSPSASQETAFYSADLHVDGRRIGTVSNGGTGEADAFHGDREAYAAADAWSRANLPPWRTQDGQAFETDLELHCAALLQEWIDEDDLHRALAERVLWRDPVDGLVYEVRHRGKIEETVASVRRRHPGVTILNELPFAMALAIWRSIPPQGFPEEGR
ncbi:hypothetical protein [Jannaschia rubra]|uniref:Uncharacterized protein n=1 Tax=Jannaschia rubra TaxID=282197 RepID=A0A0M6XUP8_9RHOB|nr:hypothetical protein [Jannaschia rubra]CTQ34830.1 hypothetical protein JAN5088_03626 [Jannaschia rubra]SFG66349.1 hypothetical protein SAMN04488517_1109 [Jannaschia rubra]